MYELLGTLYKEMFQIFDPDVFHFGGDEVKQDHAEIGCMANTVKLGYNEQLRTANFVRYNRSSL
jgi:hypothetical protein